MCQIAWARILNLTRYPRLRAPSELDPRSPYYSFSHVPVHLSTYLWLAQHRKHIPDHARSEQYYLSRPHPSLQFPRHLDTGPARVYPPHLSQDSQHALAHGRILDANVYTACFLG